MRDSNPARLLMFFALLSFAAHPMYLRPRPSGHVIFVFLASPTVKPMPKLNAEGAVHSPLPLT